MQPNFPDRRSILITDTTKCVRSIREGSRSFYMASLLLPQKVRTSACALYAFCRSADDAVDLDLQSDGAIEELRARLALIYLGDPIERAEDRALNEVVNRYSIPLRLLDGLIEGLEWDRTGRVYENPADLEAYAVRVAGTVGIMMSLLMEVRDPRALARACDLGVAMQLTNIARDVGEDARAGRLYLPRSWMRQEGIDPDRWLEKPEFDDRLANVVRRLLAEADRYYDRAVEGIGCLPASCRPAIHAARLIYREIGRVIERQHFDTISTRAVVTKSRKIRLLFPALLAAVRRNHPSSTEVLDAGRFLIDAVDEPRGRQRPSAGAPPWWRVGDRVVWVLDLFVRLREREQTAYGARGNRGRDAVSESVF